MRCRLHCCSWDMMSTKPISTGYCNGGDGGGGGSITDDLPKVPLEQLQDLCFVMDAASLPLPFEE